MLLSTMNEQFPPNMFVCTSSWSSKDWCGTFYPESIEGSEMIRVYSSRLPTVEIDATWHRMPNLKMVEAWKSRTPKGFIFSAKVPKIISHDKYLQDCESELNEFLSVMSGLKDKLGPLVLQFPYIAKGMDSQEYETGSDFIKRLKAFIKHLPKEFKWGVEIRNPKWIGSPLLDILQQREFQLMCISTTITRDTRPDRWSFSQGFSMRNL